MSSRAVCCEQNQAVPTPKMQACCRASRTESQAGRTGARRALWSWAFCGRTCCFRGQWLGPTGVSFLFNLIAAGLLVASLLLPLWHLRMEAPQYRDEEALQVAVYPHALRGDLNEITVLNQYIGVHIPSGLPQTAWLPSALVGAAALGLLVLLVPVRFRRAAVASVPVLLGAALVAGAVQAQWQMYDIGHKRDQKTKLVGVKDFNTPLIGHARIAQFNVAAGLGAGAYVIGAAILLQLSAGWVVGMERTKSQPRTQGTP